MKKNNSIILIGFMASGKSAVGLCLAKKLKLKYLSIDTLIEKEAKCKISTIFKNQGQFIFRELETKALLSLIKKRNLVIACGGGIILREENRAALKKIGTVIWLRAKAKTINKRLKCLKQRPLLDIKNNKERMSIIKKTLRKRYPLYKDSANYVIQTDDLKVHEVADKIIRKLISRGYL